MTPVRCPRPDAFQASIPRNPRRHARNRCLPPTAVQVWRFLHHRVTRCCTNASQHRSCHPASNASPLLAPCHGNARRAVDSTHLHAHHTQQPPWSPASDRSHSLCAVEDPPPPPTIPQPPMLHQSLCPTLRAASCKADMRRKPGSFLGIALLAGVTMVMLAMLKFQRMVTRSTPLSLPSYRATFQTLNLPQSSTSRPTERQYPAPLCASPQTSHTPSTHLAPPPPAAPASVAQYAQWHASARACLAAPAGCAARPPVLVYRCLPGRLCAGVGDRVRGIVGTFLLAMATRRAFFIDWNGGDHSPFNLTVALLPASIDWTLPPALATTPTNNDYTHLDWYDAKNWNALPVPHAQNLDLLTADFNRATGGIGTLAVSCNAPYRLFVLALRDNEHLRRSVPDLTPERVSASQLFRGLISTLFVPSPAVITLVAARAFQNSSLPLAVHARTGADFDERAPRLARKVRGDPLARALWACALRVRPDGPQGGRMARGRGRGTAAPARLFITGDDRGVKAGVYERAVRDGMKGEEIRVAGGLSMHIGLPGYKAPEGVGDKCDAFLAIFADLFLMARASVLVTSGSGFAKAAAYFGNITQLWVASVNTDGGYACSRVQLDWLVHRSMHRYCVGVGGSTTTADGNLERRELNGGEPSCGNCARANDTWH